MDYKAHPYHFRHLLGALFKAQPMVVLDEFLGGPPEETRNLVRRVDFKR